MIQTKDCIAAIYNLIPDHGKEWTRISKKDSDGRDVRVFQNKKEPALVVTVVATKDEIVQIILPSEPVGLKGIPLEELIKRIKENKIKISLKPSTMKELEKANEGEEGYWKEEYKNLTGRVIYSLAEVREKNEKGEIEEFVFTCGPETKEGFITNMFDGGFVDKLSRLFEDINAVANSIGQHGIDIEAAESMHVVYPIKGYLSADDLWDIIWKRLDRSGAKLRA